jgi:plastocyanin
VLAGALALLAPAAASAATQPVSVQFAAFAPGSVDALPGDTVQWSNVSPREHTVTSDTGAFASDLPAGSSFSWTFADVGSFAYHCTIHPSMTGEIDVRPVTLAPVPAAPMPPRTRIELAGRTADPSQPVTIERSADGVHFSTIATAASSTSGDWQATVRLSRTSDVRASSSSGVSETRRVLIRDRTVRIRATRRGVRVSVIPSDPGARIMLQLHLRERFGWWTVARKRLDFVSEAGFRVARRPVRARVVLVDRDGWSALATSRVVRLH